MRKCDVDHAYADVGLIVQADPRHHKRTDNRLEVSREPVRVDHATQFMSKHEIGLRIPRRSEGDTFLALALEMFTEHLDRVRIEIHVPATPLGLRRTDDQIAVADGANAA